MEFDTKLYILAIAVVITLTTIISTGVIVAGKRTPNTKLGEIWPKILAGLIAVGLISTMGLGFMAWKTNGSSSGPPIANDGEVPSDKFNFDSYVLNNSDNFSVELEYGEEFEPHYDSSLLTLVTEEIDVGKTAGEQKISLLFQDNNEDFHTIQYQVKIKDSHPPKLSGVQDIHIDNGKPFKIEDLGITATDPVDGDLEVKVDGDVSTSTAGIYTMEAYAVDVNLNKTSERFFIVVGGANEENVFAKPETDTPTDTGDDWYNPDGETPDVEQLLPLTEIAKEVISGKYGNGVKRQYALAKEGYNYIDVQDEINRLIAGGYKVPTEPYKAPADSKPAPESDKDIVDSVKDAILGRVKGETRDEGEKSNDMAWYNSEEVEKEQDLITSSHPEKTSKKTEAKAINKEKIVEKEDEKVASPVNSEKLLELDAVAKLVIRGNYGNGQQRVDKLTAEGYDTKLVQARVDSYKGILY